MQRFIFLTNHTVADSSPLQGSPLRFQRNHTVAEFTQVRGATFQVLNKITIRPCFKFPSPQSMTNFWCFNANHKTYFYFFCDIKNVTTHYHTFCVLVFFVFLSFTNSKVLIPTITTIQYTYCSSVFITNTPVFIFCTFLFTCTLLRYFKHSHTIFT